MSAETGDLPISRPQDNLPVEGPLHTWRFTYRPALNGVRGLAIVLVLLNHLALPWTGGAGAVGVTVFFVLSGFLITGLLVKESDAYGSIQLKSFYARRARRLLPALMVSTGLVLCLTPWLGPRWFEWRDLPPVLFYYGNWVQAGVLQGGDLGSLASTWSLAVEEQFYLLWPLVVLATARLGRRALLLIAVTGAWGSLWIRLSMISEGPLQARLYFGSDVVAFALFAGAALVIWLGSRRASPAPRIVQLLGIALIGFPCILDSFSAALVALPISAVGAVLVVWSVSAGTHRLFELPVLQWFGTRSYGIYLLHAPVAIYLHQSLGWEGPLLWIAVLGPPLALAEASYRWVEMPFRRMGQRSLVR